MKCTNDLSISPLCHTTKIFERIFHVRFLQTVISIPANQCGSVKSIMSGTTLFMHRSRHFPEACIQQICLHYRNATSVIRCSVGLLPSLTIDFGIHRESALSPLLLIRCVDMVAIALQKPYNWSVLYADDVFMENTDRYEIQLQMPMNG